MLPRIFNLFYLCILIFDNTGEFMKTFLLVVCCLIFSLGVNAQQRPLMLYGDTSVSGFLIRKIRMWLILRGAI